MLSNNLNTNEVKNSAGVEVEFEHIDSEGRSRVFAQVSESPSLKHRLSIKHTETGAGVKARRRSAIRFDKTTVSTVDLVTPITNSAYIVVDSPVGYMLTNAELVNVLAELLSFCATTGAATTVLFDGTGNGAKALLQGSL
jgi:hypothetical protein